MPVGNGKNLAEFIAVFILFFIFVLITNFLIMKLSTFFEFNFIEVDAIKLTSVSAFRSFSKDGNVYYLFHGWFDSVELIYIDRKIISSSADTPIEHYLYVCRLDAVDTPTLVSLDGSSILNLVVSTLK